MSATIVVNLAFIVPMAQVFVYNVKRRTRAGVGLLEVLLACNVTR